MRTTSSKSIILKNGDLLKSLYNSNEHQQDEPTLPTLSLWIFQITILLKKFHQQGKKTVQEIKIIYYIFLVISMIINYIKRYGN